MVPTSFLRQLVIRQNIGPDLVFGQIVQADGRHLVDAQQFCGCDPTVSGNDHSRAIDKNRIGEAERPDAVRNLTNLAPSMGPRVSRVGDQILNFCVGNRQLT